MSATEYTLSAKIEGVESAVGDLSRLGYAYTSFELISSRVAAAEVQVARAEVAERNIQLQMIDTRMKLSAEEQKLTVISNNYQISLGRRASLIKEVERAEASGTGTSNQYAMAQVMLERANADVLDNQVRLAQQTAQVAATENQLKIESNNLSVQQQILALDQQRVNELTIVQDVTMAQLAATTIRGVASIISMVVARAANTAAMDREALGILAENGLLAQQTPEVIANAGAWRARAAAQGLGGAGIGIGGTLAAGGALGGLAGTEAAGALTGDNKWAEFGGGALGGAAAGALFGLAFAPETLGLSIAVGAGVGALIGGLHATGTFQHGGLVTSPTLAMLGEAGPEMVSPIGRGGGATVNVNIGGAIIGGSYSQLTEHISDNVNRAFDRYIRSISG